MALQETSIKGKIMAAILLTSVTALLLTIAAFMIYDLVSYRKSIIQNLRTLGQVIADNSTAALAFNIPDDGRTTLLSLRAEPQIQAAALYTADGVLFATYPTNTAGIVFPQAPAAGGHRFEGGYLVLFEPVMLDKTRKGTLYLSYSLRLFYIRLALYAGLAVAALIGSLLVALSLSNRLQKRVSDPILALAETARVISEERDYSVRATKTSEDELGLLTDAFNQMLIRIEEQTVAIQESEARLRLSLAASRTGSWDWNLQTGEITWSDSNFALFGRKPGDFDASYGTSMSYIHPEDRERVEWTMNEAAEGTGEFGTEYRVVWPDGSVHDIVSRGKVFHDAEGKPARISGVSHDITERKRTEEASRRLATIVESSDDAIISKDLNGIITSWNRGAEELFGYTAQEAIGQSILLFIPEERHGEEARILERIRSGDRIQNVETVRRRNDGRLADVSLTVSPIKDAQGEIIAVSTIARDITPDKQAKLAVEESRARFSGIIDSAMDAIISVDSDQRVTVFNRSAERMFRCAAAEAIGQPLDKFIPERYRAAHRAHVAAFGETGTTARAMGHLRPLAGLRSDGQEFPIEASISHIEVAGHKIYTVILRDITERLQAQEALERQAQTLREQAQMLDLANVMARDLNDRVILWNTGMEKMYGWSRSEVIGRNSQEILKTRLSEPLDKIRETLMRAGEWEGELTRTRMDQKQITVASQWVLHRDREGRPVAILEINTDITERKQAEEQILHMNAALEQRVQLRTAELTAANQELEAFTYSVAHDLRAPLRHIDAFTRILIDDFASELPPEAQRFLENIRKGSQNMSHLVDDLLNLARVGRQELKRETIALKPVVDEVIVDLKREVTGRDIEWRVGPLPTASSDPGLMKQVFANLLSNAVKYSRPRKKAVIEIGEQRIDGDTAIYVRDNGVGFNMKYADKLFGVFQRLHRSDEFEGTGVGLAIVERIIRRHGGHIWADAELDKGATFYFTLNGLQQPGKSSVALQA